MFRFREVLVQSNDLDWVDKTLAGLSQKALWRNDDTGALAEQKEIPIFSGSVPAGDHTIATKLNLPPSYVLIHRTWLGGIGLLSQLGTEAPFRAILEEFLPGFADDDLVDGPAEVTEV